MCGIIINDNNCPLSFGGQHKGLTELDIGNVSFDRGNNGGKF